MLAVSSCNWEVFLQLGTIPEEARDFYSLVRRVGVDRPVATVTVDSVAQRVNEY